MASGKKASFYLDAKQVTLDARGALLVAEGMLSLLAPLWPAAVGGMSIGADPITAAMVTLAGAQGKILRGFMIRKQPKSHGTQQYLEGPVAQGERVAIVEDVATTGGSALTAIERAEEFGLEVDQVLVVVDRLEGAREIIEGRGYRFASLLTVRDLGIDAAPSEAALGTSR